MSSNPPTAPQVLWLTPLARRILDVQEALRIEPSAREMRDPVFISDSANQLRKLRVRVSVYYVVTFVGAFLVASGGLPTSATVELFGVTMPLGLLSQQALAAIVAGLFSQYIMVLLSFSMVHGFFSALMSADFGEGWEFRLSRYDAEAYCGALLLPRRTGYRSPKSELAFIALGVLTAFVSVFVHASVVVGAAFIAFDAALNAKLSLLPMALSTFALIGTVIPALLWFVACFVPMPYRR